MVLVHCLVLDLAAGLPNLLSTAVFALRRMRASFEGEQRPALRGKTTSASASTTTSTTNRRRLRRIASKRLLSLKATERLVH